MHELSGDYSFISYDAHWAGKYPCRTWEQREFQGEYLTVKHKLQRRPLEEKPRREVD